MSELKRPEKYVEFESIKPKFKDLVEFYTKKSQEYIKRILEFSEYADGLEKEISILKETPKVDVLLDNTDKQLVVVPKMVGEQIERVKGNARNPVCLGLFDSNYEAKPEYAKWIQDNINTFMSAWLDGYTVEKEKLYRLKNKITNQYINMNPYNGHCHESIIFGDRYKCVFTQSEIDGMETGSYEQINEVEDD